MRTDMTKEELKGSYTDRLRHCQKAVVEAIVSDPSGLDEDGALAGALDELWAIRPTLVVTRHKALVTYLRERGLIEDWVEVLSHVEDPSVLDGAIVVGVLPFHLAARCRAIIEIPLDLSPEDRGKELSLSRLREIAGDPVMYRVERI